MRSATLPTFVDLLAAAAAVFALAPASALAQSSAGGANPGGISLLGFVALGVLALLAALFVVTSLRKRGRRVPVEPPRR
jgi:hypothetical protein